MAQKETALEKRAREAQMNAPREEEGVETSGLDRKAMPFIIGGGLLLVAAIAWFMLRGTGASDSEMAAMELGRLTTMIASGDHAGAIAGDPTTLIDGRPVRGLEAIVDEYKGTEGGRVAALHLGEAYLATGDPAKARSAYDVARSSEKDLIRAAALVGLASVAEEEGNFEAAAGHYDEAIALYELDDVQADLLRPLYLLAAARNYEAAGNQEEAIERYRSVATLYPSSQQTSAARLALARYGEEI